MYLLKISRPFAVGRFVVPVVVDAFDCEGWMRFGSHISKEILKLFPAFADLYSASSIVFPVSAPRITASRFYPTPRFIFGSDMRATGMPMGKIGLYISFLVKTSTALRSFIPEVFCVHRDHCTTRTAAGPHTFFFDAFCSVQHGKAVECLSS